MGTPAMSADELLTLFPLHPAQRSLLEPSDDVRYAMFVWKVPNPVCLYCCGWPHPIPTGEAPDGHELPAVLPVAMDVSPDTDRLLDLLDEESSPWPAGSWTDYPSVLGWPEYPIGWWNEAADHPWVARVWDCWEIDLPTAQEVAQAGYSALAGSGWHELAELVQLEEGVFDPDDLEPEVLQEIMRVEEEMTGPDGLDLGRMRFDLQLTALTAWRWKRLTTISRQTWRHLERLAGDLGQTEKWSYCPWC